MLKGWGISSDSAWSCGKTGWNISDHETCNAKAWAPGWWEVSGGAAQAGESSEEAVCREVREETGLDISNAEGGYVFTYKRENPGEGDNYFVDVYRFVLDIDENDLKLQTEETDGYMFATKEEIENFAKEGIFLHYDSIKRVFEQLQ